jgi:asparagine synthase (glutamine-hydrolysing)
MSVQGGIWNFDGKPVDRMVLTRMSTQSAEYGPDDETIHVDGSLGIVYRPFHTTPESRLERQPHLFANGKVLTWDGRLDNRDEISRSMNEAGRHTTDTDLVALSFEKWGNTCFSKLVGEWAAAIWDPEKRELILARDYVGIRHLYYSLTSTQLTWCSLLSPLALSGASRTLCDEYIAGYLALYPDGDLTPYKEIKAVPPGKSICCRAGKAEVHSYWSFPRRLSIRYKTDREYEEHFRQVFRQAVHRRLRTESPILADLSGGFDSSSIVCVADELMSGEPELTPQVDTFSIYDSNEPDEDDFGYFKVVEQKRGREGFHLDLGKTDVSFTLEQRDFVSTPGFGDREGLRGALSTLVKNGKYRVGLSGLGGDELLGQSLDPRVQIADLIADLRFWAMAKQLVAWSLIIRRPWVQLLLQTVRLFLPTVIRARMTQSASVEPWINRRFARRHRLSIRRLGATEESQFWRPGLRDSFDTITALGQQMTFSRPSTLEKRYPYLDQTLVEFLISIPSDQLLRPGKRRSLMRRALVDLLPGEIISRGTKAAAGRCHVLTLQKHWNQLERILEDPITTHLGYVERREFHKALAAAKNGQISPYFLRLLRVVSLEMWLRAAINRGVIRASFTLPTSFSSRELA